MLAHWHLCLPQARPQADIVFPELPNLDATTFLDNQAAFQEQYQNASEPMPHTTTWTRTSYHHCLCRRRPCQQPHDLTLAYRVFTFLETGSHCLVLEASKYGRGQYISSESIAMKTCTEAIVALRYKLRQFGVRVDTPANLLCDNQSVVLNTT